MRHVLLTPTCLDHMSPVKVDINKTNLSTGKTRCSKQIWTQPRLQINFLKITTTKGHQVLLLTTMLNYCKVNQKVTTNNFVLYLFFFQETGPRLIFLDCRVSYSLTQNDNTDKHWTYQRLRQMLLTHVHRVSLITICYLKHYFLSEQRPWKPITMITS